MHVIASAGHVDHGKSALVRALTGMEPDRWEAEQRRGMTIDLGFAWTVLPSGEQVAFVNVPGHERFVSNMLAGAGPAPAVMFVVAADEGWKPQSAEHLAALDAFGVRHGLLVITRSDLADPAPATRQAVNKLAGTSLRAVESVAVSALTGAGITDLIAALDRLVAALPRPDPAGDLRLWLDRAFTIKGSGTVVTGTLQAGTVRVGDELMLLPAKREVRVRAIQSLGATVAQVGPVARVALNLRGVPAADVSRGMALTGSGQWTLTSLIDVRLSAQTGDLPPSLTVHIGASRTVARVRVLGEHLLRLALAQPLPLHAGDRVLLRDPGAAAGRASGPPILGATVLDVSPPQLRGTGAAAAARRELASWSDPPAAAQMLRRHRLLRTGAARAMGLRDLPTPVAAGWLADPLYWARLREHLAAAVVKHAADEPLSPGMPVNAARARLGLPDRRLVEALVSTELVSTEPTRTEPATTEPVWLAGGYLRCGDRLSDWPAEGPGGGSRASTQVPAAHGLPATVASAVNVVLADLAKAPFSAPDAARLQQLGLDNRALAAAHRAGLLLRLPGNVMLAAGAESQAAQVLAGLPQPFTAAQARQALDSSRRVVIPLLEHLDRTGVTRRMPDDRRIIRDPNGAQ